MWFIGTTCDFMSFSGIEEWWLLWCLSTWKSPPPPRVRTAEFLAVAVAILVQRRQTCLYFWIIPFWQFCSPCCFWSGTASFCAVLAGNSHLMLDYCTTFSFTWFTSRGFWICTRCNTTGTLKMIVCFCFSKRLEFLAGIFFGMTVASSSSLLKLFFVFDFHLL